MQLLLGEGEGEDEVDLRGGVADVDDGVALARGVVDEASALDVGVGRVWLGRGTEVEASEEV